MMSFIIGMIVGAVILAVGIVAGIKYPQIVTWATGLFTKKAP